MFKKKTLFLILFLSILLRFYKLGEIPLSPNWDEISNAYNAYSILKTGRDEYGNFLPLANRSFNDYKPPLYMYLSVLPVAIFDLTPHAARFPSALAGVLTIIFVYHFSKITMGSTRVSLLAAFSLTISTWHLQMSRAGFEANIGLFFTVASFTLFLKAIHAIKLRNTYFLFSAVLFAISAYTYHSQRIFIPILFITTLVIFREQIFKFSKKVLLLFVLISALIISPIFFLLPKEALSQRFESTTQTARLSDIDRSIEFIEQDQGNNSPASNIIHNRRVFISQTFLNNYLLHFDPNFLFVKGDDNFRHHVENMGMFYLFQLPLLLVGLFLFVKERSKGQLFLLSWMLFSPIPAIAGDAVPHALRSLTLIIPMTIISSYSLVYFYQTIRLKKTFITIASLVLLSAFFPYLHNYYFHYPRDHASWWQYGYAQAVEKSEELKNDFTEVHISSDIEQAYIFWLFSTKYDPRKYQLESSSNKIGNTNFKADAPTEPNILYVTGELDNTYEVLETIKSPKGETIIEIGYRK